MARGITEVWSGLWEVLFEGKEQKCLHPTTCSESCLFVYSIVFMRMSKERKLSPLLDQMMNH